MRQKLTDSISSIRKKYKSDNLALCVQESGHYDVSLRPHFDLPITCDRQVTFGRNDNGVRGVVTYGVGGACRAFDYPDQTNEICTIIANFKSSRGRSKSVAILNCYRNISRNYERSVDQTKAAILKILVELEKIDIKQFVIVGDFNCTSFVFDDKGARELTHPSWYHQANTSSAKHKIDKCFTNVSDAGILTVLESCENVAGPMLGHKMCAIYLGKPIGHRNGT